MVSNLVARVLSGVVMVSAVLWVLKTGGGVFRAFMGGCLYAMLYEWFSINRQKQRRVLLAAGIIYILIPGIFWIYESVRFPSSLFINMIWVFAIVWSCDIFAFFGGRLIGGPKLAPSISPKKTWSGVIVGGFAAILVAYFFISPLIDLDKPVFMLCSIFMIIASVLGDLLESKAKRILNVKDSGSLIPGHGGVCDRLDSFLLVSYVFIAIRFIAL